VTSYRLRPRLASTWRPSRERTSPSLCGMSEGKIRFAHLCCLAATRTPDVFLLFSWFSASLCAADPREHVNHPPTECSVACGVFCLLRRLSRCFAVVCGFCVEHSIPVSVLIAVSLPSPSLSLSLSLSLSPLSMIPLADPWPVEALFLEHTSSHFRRGQQ
jgi:hypothetical protein